MINNKPFNNYRDTAKIKNSGSAILFKNSNAEKFTKSNPLLIWAMYLILITAMLYYSYTTLQLSLMEMGLLFIAGSFVWTLTEYLIHRFVFHFITENKTGKKIIYLFHGNHHEYPRDKERLFMPPVPSLIISAVFFSIMFVTATVLGHQSYSFPFFCGFAFFISHLWKHALRHSCHEAAF